MVNKGRSGFSLKFNSANIITNLVLIVQMVLYSSYTFTGSRISLYLNPIVGAIGLFYFILTASTKRVRTNVILGALAIIFLEFTNIFLVGNANVSLLFREVFTYYATACLLTKKNVSRKVMLIMFYVLSIYTWSQIFIVGFPYRIFYYQSRNYIGVYLLIMLFPYYTTFTNTFVKTKESPSLIPAVICLVTSVYTLGRGSMVMAFILLYGSTLKNIFVKTNKKNRKKKIFFAILVLVVSVVLFLWSDVKTDYLYRFYSNDSSADQMRIKIWTSYLNPVFSSMYSFLFGLKLDANNLLIQFLGNTHNSFLMTHAYFGIVGFTAMIIGVVKSLKKYFKSKNYDFFIFCIAFMIKAFTDWIYPSQIGDVIILYLIMIPFLEKKTNPNKHLVNRIGD